MLTLGVLGVRGRSTALGSPAGGKLVALNEELLLQAAASMEEELLFHSWLAELEVSVATHGAVVPLHPPFTPAGVSTRNGESVSSESQCPACPRSVGASCSRPRPSCSTSRPTPTTSPPSDPPVRPQSLPLLPIPALAPNPCPCSQSLPLLPFPALAPLPCPSSRWCRLPPLSRQPDYAVGAAN